ncbi:hypothetical protein [Geodermatophilus sp. SYSU D01176]
MSVVMLIDNSYGSQEIYERASSGMTLPLGGSVHVAGPGLQGGWRVIEVWESEDEARRFVREELAPALRAAGAQGPPPSPEFWPLHRIVTGVRA